MMHLEQPHQNTDCLQNTDGLVQQNQKYRHSFFNTNKIDKLEYLKYISLSIVTSACGTTESISLVILIMAVIIMNKIYHGQFNTLITKCVYRAKRKRLQKVMIVLLKISHYEMKNLKQITYKPLVLKIKGRPGNISSVLLPQYLINKISLKSY